jgi:peptidyl-prolyl cis-trans isomerase B (cyclophilin B)
MHKDSPRLDGQYAAFGHVISGMEIVDAICESAKPTDSNGTIKADEQPVIKSITIKK